jgi:hypothetical protein
LSHILLILAIFVTYGDISKFEAMLRLFTLNATFVHVYRFEDNMWIINIVAYLSVTIDGISVGSRMYCTVRHP